jgi:hypothetical protein
VVADAEPVENAWGEVRYQDVAGLGEPEQDLASPGDFEVQAQGQLALALGVEQHAAVPRVLAGITVRVVPGRAAFGRAAPGVGVARRVDLDDLGAEVGQAAAGEGAGPRGGEVDDAQARQRPGPVR